MIKMNFAVGGMSCAACAAHVEKAVSRLHPGEVSVNLLTGRLTVSLPPDTDPAAVIAAVAGAGYSCEYLDDKEGAAKTASAKDDKNAPADSARIAAALKKRLLWSAVFLLPLMIIAMGGMFIHHSFVLVSPLAQGLLLIPILVFNRALFFSGLRSLKRGAPNMDSLIAIGSGAAALSGAISLFAIAAGLEQNNPALIESYRHQLYFESAAMILTLVTLGKYIETRAKTKTASALARLLDLSPKTAAVLREGAEIRLPAEEVRIGDTVCVRPGESVPVDGVVLEGETWVDQSALTGESMPVAKRAGDTVMSASVNQSGYIRFRALKVGKDTALAQIISLVEEASSSKAPISRLADKVSGIFVPAVIIIAVLTGLIWLALGYGGEFALSSAIAVLVVSCPCALGLATPVAIMVSAGKGAENGVIFKSAEAIELLSRADTIVLDKTGTITRGRPRVTAVLPHTLKEEIMRIACALEARSEHPLARAVLEAGAGEVSAAEDFFSIPGKGVSGSVDGEKCYLGSENFLLEQGVVFPLLSEQARLLISDGYTVLFVSRGKTPLGLIAVADSLKEDSQAAISAFNRLGLTQLVLTGDNRITAEAVTRDLAVDGIIAEVLPGDKEAVIRDLQAQGKIAVMIGDGINDAPALSRADIGIAIGAGTDIAMESADIVLMNSSLTDAVKAFLLSRAAIRNIRQNLFWAFFYNTACIPLAAGLFFPLFGWRLDPMIASAAMSVSSLTVVFNALRLRRFNPRISSKNRSEKRIPPKRPKRLNRVWAVPAVKKGRRTS